MTNLKTLAFSGLILSLATGWAHGQSVAPTPPAAPSATPGAAPNAASEPVEDDDVLSDGNLDDDDDDAATVPTDEADAERRPGRMGRMDGNRDGAIGKDEFQAGRLDRLKAADTNGDGTLSTDELEAMVLKRIVEQRAARMADRLDIDGNGTVTLAELQTLRDKRFALLDRNDDGRIDDRELALIHRGMGPERMRRGGDRHEHSGRYGRPGGRHGEHGREAWRDRGHGPDRMPGGRHDFD